MKSLNLLLPLMVASAIVGAFFAGRYTGEYDANQSHSISRDLVAASDSADRLYIAAAAAGLLKDSKSTEALRFLEQYAKVQAPRVGECLKVQRCANWIGASEEHRSALQRYADTYGQRSMTEASN